MNAEEVRKIVSKKDNQIWYYNDSPDYEYVKGKSVNTDKRWKKFEELFK
jgi:hypothetical protein